VGPRAVLDVVVKRKIPRDRSIILERILRRYGRRVWSGCTWLKVRTSGEPL